MVDWADANPRRITERFSRKIEPNAAVYLPENKDGPMSRFSTS